MDDVGQDLGFSAGKPEGNRLSSDTLGDAGAAGGSGGGRGGGIKLNADKNRPNKSSKVRGYNLGLHDDI